MNFRLTSTPHLLTVNTVDGANVPSLLDTFGPAGARATFFVDRSVADDQAGLARAIARAGHEIAVLGDATPEWGAFRSITRDAKDALEQACGAHVRGFRCRHRSLGPRAAWAFEILAEEGFEYDSSCVPATQTTHRPAVPDYPYTLLCAAGSLVELPVTRASLSRQTLSARARAGLPAVVAVDAVDLDQPRMRRLSLPLNARRATRERVAHLVRAFRFDAIGNRLPELSLGSPTTFAA